MHRNFTEALIELFGIDKSILEVGPGIYTIPTISVIQNFRPKVYVAIDGAFDLNDAFRNFNQVGGLRHYGKDISDFFACLPHNLLLVNGLAHRLPLRSESVDSVLFIKTLYKLTDGILNIWKRVKESIIEEYKKRGIDQLRKDEYKRLTISTYELLVLDEARRVGKESIAIIPESSIVEKEVLEGIKIYSELTGNEFCVLNVQSPGWKIEEDGKVKVIGHWQDNSSRKLVYLKIRNRNSITKEEISMYLRKRYENKLYKNISFRSLYEKIL